MANEHAARFAWLLGHNEELRREYRDIVSKCRAQGHAGQRLQQAISEGTAVLATRLGLAISADDLEAIMPVGQKELSDEELARTFGGTGGRSHCEYVTDPFLFRHYLLDTDESKPQCPHYKPMYEGYDIRGSCTICLNLKV